MKVLKTIDKYLETLPPEEFCLCSSQVGSKNLLIVDSEQLKVSKIWTTNQLSEVPALVVAHGFKDKGKIFVTTTEMQKLVIGMGKKTGFALFIQNIEDVFYIAICNDAGERHDRFFLTATDDKSIAGIILSLIEHYCPSVETLGQISSFVQKEVNE